MLGSRSSGFFIATGKIAHREATAKDYQIIFFRIVCHAAGISEIGYWLKPVAPTFEAGLSCETSSVTAPLPNSL